MEKNTQTTDVYFPRSAANPTLDWFIRILKGIGIGIGFILPGLSGGVLAVIFGMYDIIIRFLANIRQKFIEHVKFFIPLGIGGVLGILLFSVVVAKALAAYQAPAVSLFIGFVAGTFPSLYKKAGERGRSKADVSFMFILAFVFCVLMIVLGEREFARLPQNILTWAFSGALIGLGVIVPGMSPSNFLLYFGLYEPMTRGIANLDLMVIIPLALGALACVLLLAKLVASLFRKFYSKMYHMILGLVIGSTVAILFTEILPSLRNDTQVEGNLSFFWAVALCVILFVVGTVLSWLFSKVEEKYDPEQVQVMDTKESL